MDRPIPMLRLRSEGAVLIARGSERLCFTTVGVLLHDEKATTVMRKRRNGTPGVESNILNLARLSVDSTLTVANEVSSRAILDMSFLNLQSLHTLRLSTRESIGLLRTPWSIASSFAHFAALGRPPIFML